jgi:hypothetical protein
MHKEDKTPAEKEQLFRLRQLHRLDGKKKILDQIRKEEQKILLQLEELKEIKKHEREKLWMANDKDLPKDSGRSIPKRPTKL